MVLHHIDVYVLRDRPAGKFAAQLRPPQPHTCSCLFSLPKSAIMKTCSPVIVLAAACMLVVSAGALVLQPAKAGGQDGMPDVMFDLVFVSTPVNGVNHAVATSETLNTTFTSQGVVFTQRNVAGSTTATWLSTTGAQKVGHQRASILASSSAPIPRSSIVVCCMWNYAAGKHME